MWIQADPGGSPWYLTAAIAHALSILSWMEMPSDDQPSEGIWLDDKAIADHFERVRERYRSGSGWESVPGGDDVQENGLLKGLR